jgi:Raf kinase inhibitor-like YbhB/YbcL family protein
LLVRQLCCRVSAVLFFLGLMKKNQSLMALTLSLIAGTVSAAMSLTSTDIRPGLAIPVAHIYTRCGGENISPNLAWSGAPSGTMSFVLTMIDVDVKPDEWSHWIVVGLPAASNSLLRGAQSLPGGAKAIASNFGDAAYDGPCPPKGTGVHHYQFTVWALPTTSISLLPDQKATTLTALLSRQALDRASLVGLVTAAQD